MMCMFGKLMSAVGVGLLRPHALELRKLGCVSAELKKENAHKVRAKIAALVQAEGLDLDDVMGTRSRGRGGVRGKAKQKYRNPADPSQTWSGRGRQPLWYAAAVKAGKKDKDLLIK
jgi:DNA-binding protein H-NS